MSASQHVSPHQLAMFMPAHQVVGRHVLGDFADQSPAGKTNGLKRKQAENVTSGQTFAGGIQTPVVVNHRESHAGTFSGTESAVHDGHHRLAHAMTTNPNAEVPLQHTDMKNPMSIGSHVERMEKRARFDRAINSMPKGAY